MPTPGHPQLAHPRLVSAGRSGHGVVPPHRDTSGGVYEVSGEVRDMAEPLRDPCRALLANPDREAKMAAGFNSLPASPGSLEPKFEAYVGDAGPGHLGNQTQVYPALMRPKASV